MHFTNLGDCVVLTICLNHRNFYFHTQCISYLLNLYWATTCLTGPYFTIPLECYIRYIHKIVMLYFFYLRICVMKSNIANYFRIINTTKRYNNLWIVRIRTFIYYKYLNIMSHICHTYSIQNITIIKNKRSNTQIKRISWNLYTVFLVIFGYILHVFVVLD
jgi:hypothetical protein